MKILNEIERSDISNVFKNGSYPNPIPVIDTFMCPSDPPQTANEPQISYVVNAGRADRAMNDPLGQFEGVFANKVDGGLDSASIDFLSSGDGTSTTLLVSENVNATMWHVPSSKATSGQLSAAPPFAPNTTGGANIFVWHNLSGNQPRPSAMQRINGEVDRVTTTIPINAARPSSFHSGGVNAAFGDAHVSFLRESIDYTVYVQLMTTDSASMQGVNPAFQRYLLNDSDY